MMHEESNERQDSDDGNDIAVYGVAGNQNKYFVDITPMLFFLGLLQSLT